MAIMYEKHVKHVTDVYKRKRMRLLEINNANFAPMEREEHDARVDVIKYIYRK